MRLDFAMLADAVIATADNKIIIQGANVDNVRSPSYPAVQTTMAFVAMFTQDPSSDKPDDVHELRIETENPLGEPWIPTVRGPIATPVGIEGHPGKATAVATLNMVLFPMKGRYVFHVYVDDKVVRDIDFYAVEVQEQGQPIPTSQTSPSEPA